MIMHNNNNAYVDNRKARVLTPSYKLVKGKQKISENKKVDENNREWKIITDGLLPNIQNNKLLRNLSEGITSENSSFTSYIERGAYYDEFEIDTTFLNKSDTQIGGTNGFNNSQTVRQGSYMSNDDLKNKLIDEIGLKKIYRMADALSKLLDHFMNTIDIGDLANDESIVYLLTKYCYKIKYSEENNLIYIKGAIFNTPLDVPESLKFPVSQDVGVITQCKRAIVHLCDLVYANKMITSPGKIKENVKNYITAKNNIKKLIRDGKLEYMIDMIIRGDNDQIFIENPDATIDKLLETYEQLRETDESIYSYYNEHRERNLIEDIFYFSYAIKTASQASFTDFLLNYSITTDDNSNNLILKKTNYKLVNFVLNFAERNQKISPNLACDANITKKGGNVIKYYLNKRVTDKKFFSELSDFDFDIIVNSYFNKLEKKVDIKKIKLDITKAFVKNNSEEFKNYYNTQIGKNESIDYYNIKNTCVRFIVEQLLHLRNGTSSIYTESAYPGTIRKPATIEEIYENIVSHTIYLDNLMKDVSNSLKLKQKDSILSVESVPSNDMEIINKYSNKIYENSVDYLSNIKYIKTSDLLFKVSENETLLPIINIPHIGGHKTHDSNIYSDIFDLMRMYTPVNINVKYGSNKCYSIGTKMEIMDFGSSYLTSAQPMIKTIAARSYDSVTLRPMVGNKSFAEYSLISKSSLYLISELMVLIFMVDTKVSKRMIRLLKFIDLELNKNDISGFLEFAEGEHNIFLKEGINNANIVDYLIFMLIKKYDIISKTVINSDFVINNKIFKDYVSISRMPKDNLETLDDHIKIYKSGSDKNTAVESYYTVSELYRMV